VLGRLGRMTRITVLTAALSAVAINLAGCDRQAAPPAPENSVTAGAQVPEPMPSEVAPAPSATPTAEVSEPAVPSASRDPVEVMNVWAKAVELRDWPTVRSYWGDNGARSGLSETAFAAKWSDLIAPDVTVGAGDQEGAAGSLYYTAPVTITDGKRVIKGEVVIRRVNDVDGATPEQLRWHIESTTLAF